MKIGVIGNGVVGNATARCFMEHHEVKVHDQLPERNVHSREEVLESELVFVCLPTPQKEGSHDCDLQYIHSFFGSGLPKDTQFVLRSTVPIGTTRELKKQYGLSIVHSPEFLTARCAVTDAHTPARMIVGGLCGKLCDLYRQRFPGVPVLIMDSDESEAVKLIVNSFFAVKVAFFNEVNWLCQKLKLDWTTVRAGVLSDGRIAHSHTMVPGPDGGFGFGGTCLPKDSANLLALLEDMVPSYMVKAALERNRYDRSRR